MQISRTFSSYLLLSTGIHLTVLLLNTGHSAPAAAPKKMSAIEVSFGSGQSRGGSTPVIQKQQKLPSTASAKLPNKISALDTSSPSVQASSQALGTGVGSGSGSGSGSGTGTTSGAGAGFNDLSIRYRGLIRELVNSKKHYPRKARSLNQEGTVIAKIKLNKEGKLLKAEIVSNSPFEILDEATLEAIKNVDQFPAIPNELGLDEMTFNIPFEYTNL